MTEQTPGKDAKGEGSYQGTTEYRERTEKFLDANGDKIDALADDAARALDGTEGEALRKAEAEAKAHAKK